ncbi:uncharacterized protein STEHIDRAFT_156083 [Stereum hirsutum FP-91666 SS1]|uniref:uncharacterized protein n=1 Tax=Stereum hirsutum (strain FP-91666) TaxID=721885 RepID=UPI000440D843|nr:uncharacterized protein STEHIDRAFT_156083 [Stereum hirsutum FP-91666 SS1]EIM87093.1 hypothetical protein STEHIDRAFT_156083 [Stereum hirsutum FP-91666 SS1]
MPPFPFPTEITVRIFALSLPEDDKPTNLAQTRMSLVRVCRQWREIATGTPQLWTNISLPFAYVGRRALRLEPSTLNTWLLWSNRQPLTITLAFPHDLPWQLELVYIQVITAFYEYWRSVRLSLAHRPAAEALGSHFQHALAPNRDNLRNVLPNLSQFTFDLRGGFGATNPLVYRVPWSVPLYNALCRSSNLQALTVANWGTFDITTPPSRAQLTFAPRLRILKIVQDYRKSQQALPAYHLEGLSGFVGVCDNLASLTLRFSTMNIVQHSPPKPPLDLPKLRSLRIAAEDIDTLATLASAFRVPNLTVLSLGIDGGIETGASDILGPHFLRLLQDSAHTLQDLTLHVSGLFEEVAYRKALARLPVLSSLVIGRAYFLDDWAEIFKFLTFNFDDQKPSFPEQNLVLERLVFEITTISPLNDAEPDDVKRFLIGLADMVHSRRPKAAQGHAMAIDRSPVRPLSVVGIGRNLVGLYTRSVPFADMPVVRKAWRSLESFVDRELYDSINWKE